MENKIVYIDIEQLQREYGGVPGIGIIGGAGETQAPVCSGKIIMSMPASDRREKAYQILADEYDIRFIFDDEIPNLEFYPVPNLAVFAVDSMGGCFGSTNLAVDMAEKQAPIYYVNRELHCHRLASDMREFIQLIVFRTDWKKGLADVGLSAVKPSSAGEDYLIRALNLKRNNAGSYDVQETEGDIRIYPSLEAARQVLAFFDLNGML